MAPRVIAGRYRLVSLLGQTGMSEVWSADDPELERRVALKLLAPDADRARFDREARAAAALAHPNITQLYDYGDADGRPYMVLEYLPGGTLEDRLTGANPLPDTDTERIAAELAAGLAHAHERGLVHRDLKPANVLFDAEGRAKIADFGIARLGTGGTLTEAGTVLGTAAYISPEQAAGDPASPASDVYSFGVILFRMLTGRLPFEAAQPLELVALHRDAEPPPVGRYRGDAPPALGSLADASLAKDPGARPADGRALAGALGAPPPPAAADVTQVLPVARPGPPRGRRRAPAVAAALVLLAAGGVATALAVTHSDTGRGQPNVSTAAATVATRSLPKLGTRSAPIAVVQTAATSTAATATRTRPATTRAATTAPAPAPTVTPPATTAPPPAATTAPPPATTAPPPATTDATTTTAP